MNLHQILTEIYLPSENYAHSLPLLYYVENFGNIVS